MTATKVKNADGTWSYLFDPIGGGGANTIREAFTASTRDKYLTVGGTPLPGSVFLWKNKTVLWPNIDYTTDVDGKITFSSLAEGDDVWLSYQCASASPPASVLSAPPSSLPGEVALDSPEVYWRVGEASGATTAADASGNSRDGTYAPKTTLGVPGLISGDSDTAIRVQAVGLGAGDVGGVQIAHAAWMDASQLTLECIVQTAAGGSGFQALWDRDPGGGQRAFQFRLSSGKLSFVRICNSSGSVVGVEALGSTLVNDNVKHHLAATYDGSTIDVYVDGVLDGTASAPGGITTLCTDSLRFGWSPGGTMYMTDGIVDELVMYSHVLDASRIAAHAAQI